MFACLFLALFLYTIIREGVPAFFQNYVTLSVNLPKAEIDPQGTNDPKVIGAANFDGIVRDAVLANFPQVTGRAERRVLQGLVSSGSPVIVREQVLANPGWIGGTQTIQVPADDLLDLHFKGRVTDQRRTPGQGALALTITGNTATVTALAANFETVTAAVRTGLERIKRDSERTLDGQRRLVASLDSRTAAVAATNNASRIESHARDLAAAKAQVTQLEAALKDIETRLASPGNAEKLDNRVPSFLVRTGGGVIKLTEVSRDGARGLVVLPPSSTEAQAGQWDLVELVTPEADRKLTDQGIIYADVLKDRGLVEQRISREFFLVGASREAELAGIWSAVVGSIMTLGITLLISFPIGVAAAIYLEEFAPKNRFTELIEVNINNLAAVPSIIYGLLGLAVFLNAFDMPRSAPVVGGLVLALMTLPIIIIAGRAAIRAVPPSIKEAALGVGASHQQAVLHHVLPLAMPGILTGTILGMAHALGETAPLLMIGMVAFVVDVPKSPLDAATLLPVQIFMWADFPEVAFQQKTAAAIMILLAFLIAMNLLAVILRKRFERRW
jgi:phosphate transport system permease protein